VRGSKTREIREKPFVVRTVAGDTRFETEEAAIEHTAALITRKVPSIQVLHQTRWVLGGTHEAPIGAFTLGDDDRGTWWRDSAERGRVFKAIDQEVMVNPSTETVLAELDVSAPATATACGCAHGTPEPKPATSSPDDLTLF
jgi:hypothetical protein